MNRITFTPVPEVNEGTVLPAAEISFYPSRTVEGALSVVLISNDPYRVIEAGLRLSPEQVETLFYALASEVGDELFDLGYSAGFEARLGAL